MSTGFRTVALVDVVNVVTCTSLYVRNLEEPRSNSYYRVEPPSNMRQ
jgi:hypothetical protein